MTCSVSGISLESSTVPSDFLCEVCFSVFTIDIAAK